MSRHRRQQLKRSRYAFGRWLISIRPSERWRLGFLREGSGFVSVFSNRYVEVRE